MNIICTITGIIYGILDHVKVKIQIHIHRQKCMHVIITIDMVFISFQLVPEHVVMTPEEKTELLQRQYPFHKMLSNV